MAPDDAIGLALELAAVLHRAHRRGLVIRYLRTELIYIVRSPVHGPLEPGWHLAGIAPRAEDFLSTAAPSVGVQPLFGTTFAAPEVLAPRDAGPASDVFSMCAVLAWWITREHPFAGDTLLAQAGAITQGRRRPWQGPASVAAVLERGLDVQPERRPSLEELVQALYDAWSYRPRGIVE